MLIITILYQDVELYDAGRVWWRFVVGFGSGVYMCPFFQTIRRRVGKALVRVCSIVL